MSDPRLVDMEPGGESTQYESIRLFTQSPSKQSGQLGGDKKHTASETTPSLGTDTPSSKDEEYAQAQNLGLGAASSKDKILDDDAAVKARRQQGYGPGSGVGG